MRVGCRFLVSKPVTPDPNWILYLSGEVLRFSDQIRQDLAVIWRNLGQILTDPARFRLDLARFGQISSRSRRIRLDFFPGDKPDTDPMRPETKNLTTSPGWFRATFPSTRIIQVGFRLGTNSIRPVDTLSSHKCLITTFSSIVNIATHSLNH